MVSNMVDRKLNTVQIRLFYQGRATSLKRRTADHVKTSLYDEYTDEKYPFLNRKLPSTSP
jgi:hypothetical protein